MRWLLRLVHLRVAQDLDHQKSFEAMSSSISWLQISAITLAEALIAPNRLSKEIAKNEEKKILEIVDEVVPVNSEISFRAAWLRSQTPMRLIDAVISSTAEVTNTELWTNDFKQARSSKKARLL